MFGQNVSWIDAQVGPTKTPKIYFNFNKCIIQSIHYVEGTQKNRLMVISYNSFIKLHEKKIGSQNRNEYPNLP